MTKILRVNNVTKFYEKRYQALAGINFAVDFGEFVAIMGASGSGKTTLLNMISTLDTASGGTIYVDDHEISKLSDDEAANFRKKKLGFVFQNYRLLKSLTVRQNIAVPMSLLGRNDQEIDQKIDKLAEYFRLSDQLDKYPVALSGGQKQRVAIIRAIIKNPALLLADEPTGALDSQAAKLIMEYLAKVNQKFNTSILMVTHDSLAASYANKVIFLKDGKIVDQIVKKDSNDAFQQLLAQKLAEVEA
ncbi:MULTISPECIES: ABC transporter ATP-binding protein [unclassified Lactobacillus]|uniref:ABC transporter ATP-binding protein n=1 Tax=unclassified Lactobacillus TaxID=2620435 RepID=UPI000EFCCF54|nr:MULTISPECIES: ABC transporter ATP-binding protein [unclassified Lactobacillus]RMC40305.1 ABC transporter ATP-binding protein [Lactobacillus sp. ESL0233]RMC48173.1 ABC transporter ATP-binding protein [Lactobacillus sp. ESL0225]